MRRLCTRACTIAAVAPFLMLTACLFDIRPAVVVDPARDATSPGRYRGDHYDRGALSTLHGRGAHFAAGSFDEAGDDAVVREALRVVPFSSERIQAAARDARIMVLRRRPRAAYVVLTELMRDPVAVVRQGAVQTFGRLDARNGMRSPGHDVTPPWRGPEREAAISAAATVMLHDPDAGARKSAAWLFLHSLGRLAVPTAAEIVAALERESDPDIKGILLQVLGLHGAAAAQRLVAIDRHAPTFMAAWQALDGLLVAENRADLEYAYARSGSQLRHAILRDADALNGMQPWVEGLVVLGLAEADADLCNQAAHLALRLPTLSPAVLQRLRAAAPTCHWAASVLTRHKAR